MTNILEGFKNGKGSPFEISEASREELPEFFKEMGFSLGAEIGVFQGENLEKYCQSGLTMYGIDSWKSYDDYRTYRDLEDLYEVTKKRLAPYPNCTLVRKKSMDALEDIPGRSLDFVYIDGNHKFEYVAQDLVYWTRKVKKGGIVAGHDYFDTKGYRTNRSVWPVVDAFCISHDIKEWWIIGDRNSKKNKNTDQCLSFFFVKHW